MKHGFIIIWVSGIMALSGCAVDDGSDPYEESASIVDESPVPTSEVADEEMTHTAAGTCLVCWKDSTWVCSYPTFSCPFGWYNYFPSGNCNWCYRDVCSYVSVTGGISANPTTVNIHTGSGTGCTNISWNANCGTAQVYVSMNGGGETLFAQGTSGTQSACWIQPGSQYDFCVYEGTSHSNSLGCVRVTGVDAGPAPDPCDSCPSRTSCFCGDGVCRREDTYCP